MQLLLSKILKIVEANENLLLVVSKSNYMHDDISHPRIFTFPYVPQLQLLSYCDLMITHGGHNSIKECIQAQVKMLVFPHMENNDQPGNAARVQYHGLGLMGNLAKDSTMLIATKVDNLLSKDEQGRRMKRNIDNPHLQRI